MWNLAILSLTATVSAAAPSGEFAPAVQVFKDACVDGGVRLVRPKRVDPRRMAGGSRKALFRASRIEYYDSRKRPPPRFWNFGVVYETSPRPLTYLITQMPANQTQTSEPVCVVLTKDKAAYWGTQRAVRLWAKPGDQIPLEQPRLKVGDGLRQGGIISDQTFEARIGKQSVAVFRESGWIVMRTLDRGDRPHPYDSMNSRKNK